MTRNRRQNIEVDTALNDGEWLHRLLAPARARLRREPTPLTVFRVRQRIWLETTAKRMPLVA